MRRERFSVATHAGAVQRKALVTAMRKHFNKQSKG